MKQPTAYGMHASRAILKNNNRHIEQLMIREGDEKRYQDIIELGKSRNIPIQFVNAAFLQQHFPQMVHQGVLIWAKGLPSLGEPDIESFIQKLEEPAFILILDGVTDPHNLGACLRTADASGVHLVIIPKDKSAPNNAVVSKVACGATESVPLIRVTNLARTIEQIQQLGVWVYGACGEVSQSLYDLDAKQSIALVLGAEGDGLRRLTREKCDGLFAIPMCGMVSSLNVSVAAGVSMYEIRRQRIA